MACWVFSLGGMPSGTEVGSGAIMYMSMPCVTPYGADDAAMLDTMDWLFLPGTVTPYAVCVGAALAVAWPYCVGTDLVLCGGRGAMLRVLLPPGSKEDTPGNRLPPEAVRLCVPASLGGFSWAFPANTRVWKGHTKRIRLVGYQMPHYSDLQFLR